MPTPVHPEEKPWLSVQSRVREALALGQAVVALESTLISHGLPYPQNLQTARQLESVVCEHGAVPATIAVLGGVLRVGLTPEELGYLASSCSVLKVSRRDLPIVVARRGDGATTVAATMAVADMVGIEVFATGGIGGVHRGQPFDVSADLPELARTGVVVVCSGAKAILDLPLTLEWLETHGVPVLGYGSDEFPAFYTRSTGLPVDARVDTPNQVVAVVQAKRDLGLQGGVLVVVPVPAEDAMPADVLEDMIASALRDADAQGVRGGQLTPFLLSRLAQLTQGRSIESNVALLQNNAAVAAEIALALRATVPLEARAQPVTCSPSSL